MKINLKSDYYWFKQKNLEFFDMKEFFSLLKIDEDEDVLIREKLDWLFDRKIRTFELRFIKKKANSSYFF